jgi:two-component system cell cycle sensor histidine kinase/response regulator CckA
VDAQGRFLDVNEAYCALIGYSREELLNMSVADIEAIDTVEDIVQRIQRIIKSGHDCFETRHRCKNGKIVGIEICTTYMGADDGRLVVFARDISERKRAEEALRESEERYRSLVNNISMGQFRSTPEPGGRFLEVNPSMERITGYSREELLHMDVSDLYLWSEERQRVIEDIVSTIGVPTRELHFKKKDGAAITVSSTTVAVRNDDGQVVYFDGIVEDITERKRAEEKLKRAEENFRRSMDDSPLGIRIVAVDGELLYANKAILDIYGYSSIQELKDTPAKQRYTPEAYAEHRERARKRKTGEFVPSSYEISIVRKDGQVRHLHVFRKEVLWNGERQFQVLYQDITGRKLMEEEEQKLERLESVGILAGGIAHDFNNILTGILGNVTLAKRHVETKSRAAERLLEAEKACLRAKDLTQQLLTFSKGGAPVKKIASIAELLEETAAFALRGSKVKCEFSLPDDLWVVEVDQGQMSQVITNIVINADEAMPGGGIINIGARNTVIKRKEALPLPKGDYVEIAVKDYGDGIPKEHLGRIFDPYFTTKRKGSGLGLATAYSVVSNHHGYITVESELGVGTTFHIYLPASGKPALEKKEAAKAVPVHGKGRILVMDDEEIIRKMLSKMLSLAGYGVEVTGDGAEAVELYQKARESGRAFDAVILDLTVPGGMGGKEAMKKLLEIDPEVKAIVSSGYATDPIMADFYKYGFSAVVAKPYSVGELERALHRMLR